jgi:hypothetical protein
VRHACVVVAMLVLGLGMGMRCYAAPIAVLPIYVPAEVEVERMMNLHAYLKQFSDDLSRPVEEPKLNAIIDMSQQYNILQTYALEAFVQSTPNSGVTGYYRRYAGSRWPDSPAVKATIALADTPRKNAAAGGQSPTMTLPNGKTAESIELFTLKEASFFDNRLHAMIFSQNPWSQYTVGGDADSVLFTCGGGTNAFSMLFKRLAMPMSQFIDSEANGDYFRKRYENWSVARIQPTEVLLRAGADAIYLGQGATVGSDGIKEGGSALFFYSKRYGEGFEIYWSMNFAPGNVFYEIPERSWHYLAETMQLSWVE